MNFPPPNFGDSATDAYLRRSKRLNVAGTVVSAAAAPTAAAAVAIAAIPAVPWTQIAGAVIGLVALGLKVGAKLKLRGAQALQGDERAVAGYARRAARWSSGRRARAAQRLLTEYRQLNSRKERRKRKPRQLAKVALVKMKLAVLYGLEANARKDQKSPTIAGDAASAPAVVEQDPAADVSQPADTEDAQIWWYAAGAAALVGGALILRGRRGAA